MRDTARMPHKVDHPNRRQAVALTLVALAGPASFAQTPPLVSGAIADEIWTDARRQRSLPVRVRWPSVAMPAPAGGWPVLLFSHGLGGTRAGGSVWAEAWAAAGFVVVHLQHPGSDRDAVRAVASSFGDRQGLRRAASALQLLARLQDVIFALDEIGQRNASGTGPWTSVRPSRVGMSGHSFGAHTTLGIAGQRYPGHPGLQDRRLAAFIAFSPSPPASGDARQAFERIVDPVLCITGTRDDAVLGTHATAQRRIDMWDDLPAGHKAQLVLQDADHMTFAGQTGQPVEILPRVDITRQLQPLHHAQVAAISTDWWRAQLRGDEAAAARLSQPAGLAPADRWRTG
jgi:predicted dienelactone hydrolase